jgi:hypothetical protein
MGGQGTAFTAGEQSWPDYKSQPYNPAMLWKILLYVTGAASIVGGAFLTPFNAVAGGMLLTGGGALIDRAISL